MSRMVSLDPGFTVSVTRSALWIRIQLYQPAQGATMHMLCPNFLQHALVSRVNQRMCIRRVWFGRSTWDALTVAMSGLSLIPPLHAQVHVLGVSRFRASRPSPCSLMQVRADLASIGQMPGDYVDAQVCRPSGRPRGPAFHTPPSNVNVKQMRNERAIDITRKIINSIISISYMPVFCFLCEMSYATTTTWPYNTSLRAIGFDMIRWRLSAS